MKTIGIETACRTNNYNKALASARLRCYDLIRYFKDDPDINIELYQSHKKYDIVVFQKLFTEAAIKEAKRIKAVHGTKTVFDIGTNYIELDDECVSEVQKERCIRMLMEMDYVTVSSPFLRVAYQEHHCNVHFVNDAVEDRFLKYDKEHTKVCTKEKRDDVIKFVYCGYSAKAQELKFINTALLDLWTLYQIQILYITDRDPGNFLGIPYEFIPFDYAKLPEQLMQGDIKISPRNLDRIYNMGHSVVKIAYPMSVGLPVVASPVPSYVPYLQEKNICRTNDEWFLALERLIWQGTELRRVQGVKNKEIVKEKLCLSVIGKEWKEFFVGI